MAQIVVDASVVVKWYIPERHREQARALRDDYLNGTHDLSAPMLLSFEVIHALKYSGYFGEDDCEAATAVTEYGLELVSFSDLGDVVTIATDAAVTVYDAAYIALADSRETVAYIADMDLMEMLENTDYSGAVSSIQSH